MKYLKTIADVVIDPNVPKGNNFYATIQGILSAVFVILGIVAVGFIIYGGFIMMTSAGDPGKVAKGKKCLIYSIVGLIVAIMATVIVNFVINSLQNP